MPLGKNSCLKKKKKHTPTDRHANKKEHDILLGDKSDIKIFIPGTDFIIQDLSSQTVKIYLSPNTCFYICYNLNKQTVCKTSKALPKLK